jgi:uncharacterized protein (DUF1501 family)
VARENHKCGSEHGHANVMLALGGGIKGGNSYCDSRRWKREQLYEQRDLNLTKYFRDVLNSGPYSVRKITLRRSKTSRTAAISPDRFDQPPIIFRE